MADKQSRMGTFGWAEIVLVVSILGCLWIIGVRIMATPSSITILDRPRNESTAPDFIVRYLDATGADYEVESSFLKLPVNAATNDRLRGLLSALGTYIDLLQDDRQAIILKQGEASVDGNGTLTIMVDRRTAEPTSDGRLAIAIHSVRWSANAWQEFDQLLASLEAQYCEVAEALQKIDPAVVVPRRFTPAEPVILASQGQPSVSDRSLPSVRRSENVEIVDVLDEIPLPDAKTPSEESHLPPANQGHVLGN